MRTNIRDKPIIGVGTIIVHPNGSVLLGYRTKSGEDPTWCLPGGHVEPGESFEMAALREVAEETGLNALTGTYILAVTQNLESVSSCITGAVLTKLSQVDVAPRVLEPKVFSLWRWFKPYELPCPLFSASAAILAVWLKKDLPHGWKIYNIRKE